MGDLTILITTILGCVSPNLALQSNVVMIHFILCPCLTYRHSLQHRFQNSFEFVPLSLSHKIPQLLCFYYTDTAMIMFLLHRYSNYYVSMTQIQQLLCFYYTDTAIVMFLLHRYSNYYVSITQLQQTFES